MREEEENAERRTLNLQRRTAETAAIEVGQFTLRPFHAGSVWLQHQDGEGMQIWIPEFEKILADYWREYF